MPLCSIHRAETEVRRQTPNHRFYALWRTDICSKFRVITVRHRIETLEHYRTGYGAVTMALSNINLDVVLRRGAHFLQRFFLFALYLSITGPGGLRLNYVLRRIMPGRWKNEKVGIQRSERTPGRISYCRLSRKLWEKRLLARTGEFINYDRTREPSFLRRITKEAKIPVSNFTVPQNFTEM